MSKQAVESAEFWLSESRFIQQVGEAEPSHVPASREAPVKVVLPLTFKRRVRGPDGQMTEEFEDVPLKEDSNLKRVRQASLKPVTPSSSFGKPPNAAQVGKLKPESAKPDAGERAADK